MNKHESNQFVTWAKKNVDFIKTLNFNDEEIIDNALKIKSIHANLQTCSSHHNKCIEPDEVHEVFYRDANNKLKIHMINCPYHPHTYNARMNLLVHDFPNEWIDLIFSKENITTNQKQLQQRLNLLEILKTQLINKNYQSLYLWGNKGVGKSYIMALFANKLSNDYTISYINLLNLISLYKQDKDLFFEKLELASNCDILILDDLGIEKFTYWIHIETILPILHKRMNHNLPTYFISNFDLKKLELKYTRDANQNFSSKEDNKIIVIKFIQIIKTIIKNQCIYLDGDNWLEKE